MKDTGSVKLGGIIRISIVAMSILLQLSLLLVLVYLLSQYAVYVYFTMELLSTIAIVALAINKTNSAYTIAWMLIMLLLPIFGLILYLLWGRPNRKNPMHDKVNTSIEYGNRFIGTNDDVIETLHALHPNKKQVYSHLERKGFGVYTNTNCNYFPAGELLFDAMIEDMENARQSIFLCYFILNTGKLWDRIRDVIVRKAAEGVEVRLMYDDIGSIFTAPDNLISDLEKNNIQVVRFSPATKFISRLLINLRNHQKMTIIDGGIGYTGGANISDEYANYYSRYGHWKDNAIRMQGEAVWGLTVIFLQMWDSQTGTYSEYEKHRPDLARHAIENEKRLEAALPDKNTQAIKPVKDAGGYFIPFADGPNNNPDNPAEAAYRSMIANACKYLYITTPYLVIDETMRALLCTAATAGVDVRIIVPHNWDHWYVKRVSFAHYKTLLHAGVGIYEYTPGFIHAKTIISDDEHCIIGSINMDYRSFNLHYENGVWMCNTQAMMDIKADIMDILSQSTQILPEDLGKVSWPNRLVGNVLRLFEVLM